MMGKVNQLWQDTQEAICEDFDSGKLTRTEAADQLYKMLGMDQADIEDILNSVSEK